tara:strand:+ start:1503 stop:1682 length:180 start_codon:yes stop_codon:yes gene_type:complete
MFQTKEQATEWALDQLKKYGIKQPQEYTVEELTVLNPTVPTQFIKDSVRKNKEETNVSV